MWLLLNTSSRPGVDIFSHELAHVDSRHWVSIPVVTGKEAGWLFNTLYLYQWLSKVKEETAENLKQTGEIWSNDNRLLLVLNSVCQYSALTAPTGRSILVGYMWLWVHTTETDFFLSSQHHQLCLTSSLAVWFAYIKLPALKLAGLKKVNCSCSPTAALHQNSA